MPLTPEEILNRTQHHPPSSDGVADKHMIIRERIADILVDFNEIVPESREKSLAITKLEEAMMWANAGIARNQ